LPAFKSEFSPYIKRDQLNYVFVPPNLSHFRKVIEMTHQNGFNCLINDDYI